MMNYFGDSSEIVILGFLSQHFFFPHSASAPNMEQSFMNRSFYCSFFTFKKAASMLKR